MTVVLTALKRYSDENGNSIEFEGEPVSSCINISFAGKNNKLIVDSEALFTRLNIVFQGSGGRITLGKVGRTPQRAIPQFGANFLIGRLSTVSVADYVTSTAVATFDARMPGMNISVGRDCMFATNVALYTSDMHLIYDVKSKTRINPDRDINIGSHVWLAHHVICLAGTNIGDGTVVGLRSIVKGKLPNNCTAAGQPARVLRKNIAWERTSLPPDTSADHWNMTEAEPMTGPSFRGRFLRFLVSFFKR